ncbi:putative NAC domain-containing protein 7 [Cocos nucifera]|uniref:Putative NAC domain-containing protein 7 n=1 Tax=Cocos nucifera TaxID=13894 RepID=A0A8K0ILS5_COCNU|nr:putative NAC domain-containing protein 7 [Cocos nucifera]
MGYHHHQLYSCKSDLDLPHLMPNDSVLQLPQLESPKLPSNVNQGCVLQSSTIRPEEPIQHGHQLQIISLYNTSGGTDQSVEQVTDWRVLDKFVASQLSHDDVSKGPNYSKQEATVAYASTSTSSGQINLWK